jgi:hypothetical protein
MNQNYPSSYQYLEQLNTPASLPSPACAVTIWARQADASTTFLPIASSAFISLSFNYIRYINRKNNASQKSEN